MKLKTRLKRAARKAVFGRIDKGLYQRKILKIKPGETPDFLGIGARKSGTTWLYSNLRCHPELFLPDKKELVYFNVDYERLPFRSYLSNFKQGYGLTKGEITPSYGIIAIDRISFIHSLMPDLKMIFLMRNPVERAWADSYAYLVTTRNRRLEDVNDEEFFAHFKSHRCLKRGNYLKIIENWLSVFPQEQLHLGYFWDIEERPREMLADIFRFLGVSANVDWNNFPAGDRILPDYDESGCVNSGTKVREYRPTARLMPQRFKDFLIDLHTPQIDALCSRFPEYTRHWKTS